MKRYFMIAVIAVLAVSIMTPLIADFAFAVDDIKNDDNLRVIHIGKDSADMAPMPEGEFQKEIIGKDGAEMVLIPEGECQIGSDSAFVSGYTNTKPAHAVYVNALYIDKYEVTNKQYKEFLDAKPEWRKDSIDEKHHDGNYLKDWDGNDYPSDKVDHPVVYVSWYAASAYAEWAGKRLPTEAEWEKAARGGLRYSAFPWGNRASHESANYLGKEGRDAWDEASPVGSFPPNGYGLYDMAGNVYEWCADWYDANYYSGSPTHNPKGPNSGSRKVVRGGAWPHEWMNLTVFFRACPIPNNTSDSGGFRCIQDVPDDASHPDDSKEDGTSSSLPSKLKEVIGRDGASMVLIPASEFKMGTDPLEIPRLVEWAKRYNDRAEESWFDNETPDHKVYLDAFYIDKYEVTNKQYKKFLDAKPEWRKDRIDGKYHNGNYLKDWDGDEYPLDRADHPVASISWYAASAYAEWAGKRLPTEAEWEKAARGGLVGKRFPWGDDIFRNDANYLGKGGRDVRDVWNSTSPVGSFRPNGYGLYDMSGNVLEWCADWYGAHYYSTSPESNPIGPDSGRNRLLRGGSWIDEVAQLRVAERVNVNPDFSSVAGINICGFRCAQDVPK